MKNLELCRHLSECKTSFRKLPVQLPKLDFSRKKLSLSIEPQFPIKQVTADHQGPILPTCEVLSITSSNTVSNPIWSVISCIFQLCARANKPLRTLTAGNVKIPQRRWRSMKAGVSHINHAALLCSTARWRPYSTSSSHETYGCYGRSHTVQGDFSSN